MDGSGDGIGRHPSDDEDEAEQATGWPTDPSYYADFLDENNQIDFRLVFLQMIKANNPVTEQLSEQEIPDNMTNEGWEELGRDISNNTHLQSLSLCGGALNDRNMSLLCQGLVSSASITTMHFYENGLSAAAVRSMVPFLQNANNLTSLSLENNNIQSEGFNLLFWALRDSPIDTFFCHDCGIEAIEIDNDCIPKLLTRLDLGGNSIGADGCHELSKLLVGDSTMHMLILHRNKIDDDGVEMLVNTLRNNTSLTSLGLLDNTMTIEGMKLCVKLVNDISSITATLESNHTLRNIILDNGFGMEYEGDNHIVKEQFQGHIDHALGINRNNEGNPEAVGRAKVIEMQLNSVERAKLADLLGVNHSVYGEINPLHLPEVLALVGQHHGQIELYVALRSSIAGLISTVNRKQCIEDRLAYHAAIVAELSAELAAINAENGVQ